MGPTVKIFAGNGSHELALKIAQRFGASLGKINIQKFSDGERVLKLAGADSVTAIVRSSRGKFVH